MDVLKTAMDDAAAECSLAVPSLFASNTADSYTQLKRYMRQTASELLERIDWSSCTIDYTLTGGGDTFTLPDDFLRLTRSDDPDEPAVWSDSMRRRFSPVTSNAEWTVLQSFGPTPNYGYRIVGQEIQFTQTLGASETVTISYVSKDWISHASVRSETWQDDADFTYLPARLIELGTTWRWMRKRGLEFASYMADFEIVLARAANDDRSIRKINFGQRVSGGSPYRNLPVPTLGPDPDI